MHHLGGPLSTHHLGGTWVVLFMYPFCGGSSSPRTTWVGGLSPCTTGAGDVFMHHQRDIWGPLPTYHLWGTWGLSQRTTWGTLSTHNLGASLHTPPVGHLGGSLYAPPGKAVSTHHLGRLSLRNTWWGALSMQHLQGLSPRTTKRT